MSGVYLWFNLLGRTLIYRDFRFIFCFAIHLLCVLKITTKPNWPGVGCTSSDLVRTSCTRSVQENDAIDLVILQSTEIFRLTICWVSNTHTHTYIHTHTHTHTHTRMHAYTHTYTRDALKITSKPRVYGLRFDCASCTRGVQRNGAICLVLLQSTEILELIFWFGIHFLCMSIENFP